MWLSCAPSVSHAPQPSLIALGCPHAALKHVQSRAGPRRGRRRRRPFPRAFGKLRRRALGILGDLDAAPMLWLIASHLSGFVAGEKPCGWRTVYTAAIFHPNIPSVPTAACRGIQLLDAVYLPFAGHQARNSKLHSRPSGHQHATGNRTYACEVRFGSCVVISKHLTSKGVSSSHPSSLKHASASVRPSGRRSRYARSSGSCLGFRADAELNTFCVRP